MQISLTTERLILRPFELTDAKRVQQLAGDKAIADTTLNMPHPYLDGMAEEWISTHQSNFEANKEIIWAITLKDSNKLIGCIGILLNMLHNKAELGYWIGKEYWNNGYATEAAKSVLSFAFDELNLNKIFAFTFTINPASAKVLTNLGMSFEGLQRKDILKDSKYFDVNMFSILKNEFV